MNRFKKFLALSLAFTMTGLAAFTAFGSQEPAGDVHKCQLFAHVTDAGQVVDGMIIDLGAGKAASGVDAGTFQVHATASTEAHRAGTDITSYGDYDIDRKIVRANADGQYIYVYFDQSEGATLSYLSNARNYPADLTYTITQLKPFTLSAPDGRVISDAYTAAYTCDNSVSDEETVKFQSVHVDNGINYQFYNAGEGVDKLIVWFHGNGEGDSQGSGNNVAQMLANRGTVAWATEDVQNIFGKAHVMAFQAPDTWYYAQRDGLLDKAAEEISAVVQQYGVDPAKVVVSGCSAGGYMTSRMLIAHPELFAAALINCPAYDVASDRGGETPTDEELQAIKASGIPIWLVQGETDSSVATDQCSKRLFAILTEGETVSEKAFQQEQKENSDFVTYETPDNKYKLTLYETTDDAKLRFAEDYDRDGVYTEVQYSNHWSWIYSLNNNPQAADGTHIINWLASYVNK